MNAIAQMPIGRIINMSRSKGHAVSYLSETIESKLSKIVDIITYRLPLRGAEVTYQSVASDMFALRFDMINQMSIKELMSLSESDESDTVGYKNLTGLNCLVGEILPIYFHIIELSLHTAFAGNRKYNNKNRIEPINLDSLRVATSFLPNEQGKIINDFVDDSLRVEFGLIASDCFAETGLSPLATDNLYQFLKLAFERYAARASFLKLWNLNAYLPTSQLVRNIQIVQSTMQAEAGQYAFQSSNLTDIKTHFATAI